MHLDFSLMLIIKWWEKRDKLRKDLWKKKPALDDLEILVYLNNVLWKQANGVARQTFTEEVRCVTHGCNQLFSSEARKRGGVIQKGPVENPYNWLYGSLDVREINKVFKELHTNRNPSLVWKWQRWDKMKDDCKGKATDAKANEGGATATW